MTAAVYEEEEEEEDTLISMHGGLAAICQD